MKVTIKDNIATIIVPVNPNPTPSSTGKSLILYSSSGFARPADCLVNGKQVSVGLNIILALK